MARGTSSRFCASPGMFDFHIITFIIKRGVRNAFIVYTHAHTKLVHTGGDASSACFDICVSCCHKTGFEMQRCAARSSGGQLLRVHGGRLGRRHRLGLELGDVVAERRGGVVGGGAWFLLTWMRMDEAAATVMRTSPPAMAAVFLAPSSDVPAVPELMALSATYTVGCMRVSVSPQNQSAAVRCYHLISFKKKGEGLRARPTKPGLVV
jgi:hypothetical protein